MSCLEYPKETAVSLCKDQARKILFLQKGTMSELFEAKYFLIVGFEE
jgi:hypothetical protein